MLERKAIRHKRTREIRTGPVITRLTCVFDHGTLYPEKANFADWERGFILDGIFHSEDAAEEILLARAVARIGQRRWSS